MLLKAKKIKAAKIAEKYAMEYKEEGEMHEWLSKKLKQIISLVITSFNSGKSLTESEK